MSDASEKKFHVVKCNSCSVKFIVPSSIKSKSCHRCGKKNVIEKETVEVHDTLEAARQSIAGNTGKGTVLKRASDF